ncbi:MAG: hypothetical protein AB1402_06440 [Bacillota bacterium]
MKRYLIYGLILAGLGLLILFRPMILDGQTGHHGGQAGDERDIERLIERAVGSLEYTQATNRAELERILAGIYTEPALSTVSEAVWEQWGTDNVNPASVLRWTDFWIGRDRARVAADLYFRDWTDNAEFFGEGRWELVRTGSGWRIADFEYHWGY